MKKNQNNYNNYCSKIFEKNCKKKKKKKKKHISIIKNKIVMNIKKYSNKNIRIVERKKNILKKWYRVNPVQLCNFIVLKFSKILVEMKNWQLKNTSSNLT